MKPDQNNSPAPKGEILFPGNRSFFVRARGDEDAAALITALGIKKPAVVLLLIGGAADLDANLNAQVEQLLDGLATAASDTDALIIDGGTEAGVMALMGKVIAERGRVTQLLGIAPTGKVTYPGGPAQGSIADGAALDPNHSHFVLVEGSEWSSSTEIMFKLVAELAKQSRVVTVLINGGEEAEDEVSRCAAHGWPLIVIQGSGRLADELAARVAITAQENIEVIGLNDPPAKLRESIVKQVESILIEAWRRFVQYDSTAISMQNTHTRFLSGAFALGVLGTLFAVTQKQLMTGVGPRYDWIFTASIILLVPIMIFIGVRSFVSKGLRMFVVGSIIAAIAFIMLFRLERSLGTTVFLAAVVKTLGYLLLVVPFVTSVLATASDRFKPSKKWILMRSGAEAVKKEIFRYRAQVSEYSGVSTNMSREQILAEKLATISRRLMRTEASSVSLRNVESLPLNLSVARADDGLSSLSAERYLEVRLENQLNYYSWKTTRLDRQTTLFQWSIIMIGGLGTLLAALGDKLWIAATSALVTGLTAYIAQLQLDPTLIKYNQSAAELRDLRTWWIALPVDAKLVNKDKLVEESEKILEGELTGWLETMAGSKKEESGERKQK